MRTKAGLLVGSGDHSHKYDIPLPPTLSPSMLAWPENMEGRSPCRENNDSLPIQIPWCDTPFGQFKEEKLMQLGCFFLERNRISLSQRFWLPTS